MAHIRQFTIKDFNNSTATTTSLNLNDFLSSENDNVKIGVTYKENDPFFNYSTTAYKNFPFIIGANNNNTTVIVGKTDIYQSPVLIKVSNMSFPIGVPKSIQINICKMLKEEEE